MGCKMIDNKVNPFDHPDDMDMNSIWIKVNFKGWECWGDLPDEYNYVLDDECLGEDLCQLVNDDWVIDIGWYQDIFKCVVINRSLDAISWQSPVEVLRTKDPAIIWQWLHYMADKYRGAK